MERLILVINPGSISTKVALFTENGLLAEEEITHPRKELDQFERIYQQSDYRKKKIWQFLEQHPGSFQRLGAVVGRGGLLKPIPSGTYLVNEKMLTDLRLERYQSHAPNLGAILAHEIAHEVQVEAYIVDPVVVDELQPIARISGLQGIERRSIAHVLNQKAVARKVLAEAGAAYEKSNVIVAHMGGGISIGAHKKGRLIDVVNGLDGEGPFSPERTGTLPLYPFAEKIINERLPLVEVKRLIAGQGGLYSYLKETDIRKIPANHPENQFYVEAVCYQISKAIGEMAVVLQGDVAVIILTGGMAHATVVTNRIQQAVSWLAPVTVVPGQMEMQALYEGVKRVWDGIETVKRYQ